MRTVVTVLALAALLVALAACGEAPEPERGAGEGEPGGDADADETAVVGVLAGDAQLEGGCVWVEADDARYEVLWPQGWQADVDPVALRDPDGEVVARAGDEIRVTGAEAHDVATVCQVGTPFEASAVEPR